MTWAEDNQFFIGYVGWRYPQSTGGNITAEGISNLIAGGLFVALVQQWTGDPSDYTAENGHIFAVNAIQNAAELDGYAQYCTIHSDVESVTSSDFSNVYAFLPELGGAIRQRPV